MSNLYHNFNTSNPVLDESLENYLIHGFEPGGFLTAVLANDLFMAVGRADHGNKHNLPRIVNEVLYKMPSHSHGSYAAVKDWCANKNERRTVYVNYKKEQTIIHKLEGSFND